MNIYKAYGKSGNDNDHDNITVTVTVEWQKTN